MAVDQNGTAFLSNIAVRDSNRLLGSVAKALAANSPWINVLKGGTFKSGVGDTVLASVEMQAAPGDSLAQPVFTNTTQISGTTGTTELTGKIDFSYSLQSKRGRGPSVDVNQGYGAFKTSYLTAEDALRKLIVQYVNADIQNQLLIKSASKFVCKSGNTFAANFTGGTEVNIGTVFPAGITPDSQLSFECLHATARYLKEALFGDMFEAGGKVQPHFRFIGSSDTIEYFRDEVGVQNVLIGLTTGGYKLGEEGVSAYSFETSPAYRGIAFGTTQRPLRFNTIGVGTANMPDLLNPVLVVSNTDTATDVTGDTTDVNANNTGANTAYSVPNPAWLSATYEIGFLIADGTFERQTPEKYSGEGTFKFAPQLCMGELNWHYVQDNATNTYGDYGFHKYQITRAYKPIRPQHIIPLIYKRAQSNLNLTAI